MKTLSLNKSKFIATPKKIDEEALKYCHATSFDVSDSAYRSFLENISIGDHIESNEVGRGGRVVCIMRDRFGIPVCAKTIYELEDGSWGYDMVPLNTIDELNDYDWMCE